MRRKPLTLILVSLVILSVLFSGCRRNSAAPPLDELTPEEEAAAAVEEAQANTEASTEPAESESPLPTPVPTLEPTVTPEPTAVVVDPTPEPTATTPPVEQVTVEPTPVQPTLEPTAPPSSGTTHVVQAGENLFRISLRYGMTVAAVAQANNITNPALIYVGQTLVIPAGGTTPPTTPPGGQACSAVYTVQPGDNLFRIALRYNYSQFYLAQYNGISNPSLVYVGQRICIP